MVVDPIFLLVIVAGTVVPGDLFSPEGFLQDRYYDHIIDFSLDRLKKGARDFKIDVDVKDPKTNLYGYGVPVEGTLSFEGLFSLTCSDPFGTFSKRLMNGELDLFTEFKFGKISGTGNFIVHGKQGPQREVFSFSADPFPRVEVVFRVTKDATKKHLHVLFNKPRFDYPTIPININPLLEDKTIIVFDAFFQKLYDIIDERLILTAPRHDWQHDEILENVFDRIILEKKMVKVESHDNTTTWDENHKESTVDDKTITVYGLHSLKRIYKTSFIREPNGDLNLLFTIKFGNISGFGSVVNRNRSTTSPHFTTALTFTFESPPTVAEAIFYLPRNKSDQQYTYHFVEEPVFTTSTKHEEKRRFIERDVEILGRAAYGQMLQTVLNETHNQIPF